MGRLAFVIWVVLLAAAEDSIAAEQAGAFVAPPVGISRSDLEFFEKSVRPLLVEKCYRCHSAEAKIVQGGLRLDSRQAVAAGGDSGEIVSVGDLDESLLIHAVRWDGNASEMPPNAKLSETQIAVFERWVSLGVPDPREAEPSAGADSAKPSMDIEQGRKWWAFQRVTTREVPSLESSSWPIAKLDHFVLAKLEENRLEPSPLAAREVLIRRATLDLTGLRPNYEQIQAFVSDDSPAAYSQLIERLLDSPQYGERWGRYWFDVVRYGEDNFTGEATTPPFPFAWRYRDWVIGAINDDVPYDRFVKLQLAADLMSDVPRSDLVALGFLGAAPSYHKDGRLSKDVVETLYMDDWDERVDTVTRGLLGMTVSCARCHDHKFDPIPTADYYSLLGVFASTVQAPRPLADIDAAAEAKFMVDAQRIFYRAYVANLLRDDPGSKPTEAREKVKRYSAEMIRFRDENVGLRESHPELYEHLSRLARLPQRYADEPEPETVESDRDRERGRGRGRGRRDDGEQPMFQAVYDAGFYVDGSDPDLTMLDIRLGETRDFAVLGGGNVTKPGEIAPRGFLSVLSQGDPRFHQGSGRLELAERIFSDASALSARVIVNRVWAWHFGKPLVGTPSDFGTQGDLPTHPALLDDLAARFIDNGYSLKWLHREIMLSATYQQSSRPRREAAKVDPANHFLWRMNPRRLDIEAYRDCMLQASGELDERMGGTSSDLDDASNGRRTVYGRIGRERQSTMLVLYDFPPANTHSPQRESTTSPLQQLFMMNSTFVRDRAAKVVSDLDSSASTSDRVRVMYRRILGRDPSSVEIELAERFINTSTATQYAQALFATNEVIFWP